MFHPFVSEQELEPDDIDKCMNIYLTKSNHNGRLRIENVQNILLKHLVSVENGTERAEEMLKSRSGDFIDPEFEQDNDDCENDGPTEHADFAFKDPSDLDDFNTEPKRYKPINLDNEEMMDEMARKLDEDQRTVLEKGVDYAKSIVKSRKQNNALVPPPLVTVQGGAGTVTVINVLSQQMEKILRTSGDNPDHPYIIKAAFTGTAAANIKGQTLHTAFSFSFGNEFFTLGDKARDERRCQLENLKVVIIDEFSMMKADMLYQLDLRLREVKEKPDLLFGGVSIFYLEISCS